MASLQTRPKAGKEADRRETKRGGLFARLFGSGVSGGRFAIGGLGADFGGLVGSGLLATKAGLLLVVLASAIAAGGLVMIGYHLLASGSDKPGVENVPLFAQKPKEEPSPEVPPISEDGKSQSLQIFSQANPNPGAPGGAAGEAPKDETAAGAAGAVAASIGEPNAAAAAGAGNGADKNLLKAPKIGVLTGPGGSAPGKGPANSGGAAGADPGVSAAGPSAAARAGALSAMKKGAASSGGVSSHGRGFGGTGAAQQAFGVMRDNRSATSSAGGGTTYDGSTPSGANPGGLASIGPASPAASDAAQPTSLPGEGGSNPDPVAPPTPPAVEAAPWQNAIHTAQILIALATGLMLVASLLSKTLYGHILAMIVAAVVASIGAMVIALGAQIANGQYGQKLQGGVLAAAGLGLMVAAAATAFGGSSNSNSSGLNTSGASDADAASDADDADDADDASDASGSSGSGSGNVLSNINPFVLIGGGIGLIGLAGTMMVPPTKYPSSDFQNGNPPDTHWFGYRRTPSETALKKMVA
jgi:hypothetical protein